MRIIICAFNGDKCYQNPYLDNLCLDLEKLGHDVDINFPEYLKLLEYDIIWVHWPEQLNVAYVDFDIDHFIMFIKNNGLKLYFTMHNLIPHGFPDLYKNLTYQLLSSADKVFHFEDTSLEKFRNFNKNSYILPHHITSYPTILKDEFNLISVGSIRTWAELKIVFIVAMWCFGKKEKFTYVGKCELGIFYARYNNNFFSKLFWTLCNIIINKFLYLILDHRQQLERQSFELLLNSKSVYLCTKVNNLNSAGVYDAVGCNQFIIAPERTNMADVAMHFIGSTYNPKSARSIIKAINICKTYLQKNKVSYDMAMFHRHAKNIRLSILRKVV